MFRDRTHSRAASNGTRFVLRYSYAGDCLGLTDEPWIRALMMAACLAWVSMAIFSLTAIFARR